MNLFLKILVGVCLVGICVAVGAFGGCLASVLVALAAPRVFSGGMGQTLGQWIFFIPMILGAIVGLAGGLFLSHLVNKSSKPRE